MSVDELRALLADPMERICSGKLYKIIVKANDGEEGKVMPFIPNRAQRRFLARLHSRNIILKARQLGFTTLICIVWLDHALFNENQRCAIVAQDLPTAQAIFRDKVKFAYDHLPPSLRAAMPLATDSKTELLFKHNNSSVKVAVSVRGGTIDRLHVSEFGKICAHDPAKAGEVVTGSLPAVPVDGIAVIESTAEGQGGEFHDMVKIAEANHVAKKVLTPRDWRFHFFPWWQEPGYVLDPAGVIMTDKDHEYFDAIEVQAATRISMEQRAWYVATRDTDFAGKPEKMWQEYPSTPAEAFQQSTIGCYYTHELTLARKQGRIGNVPYAPGTPVNTFWDIGSSDGTAIWFHQRIGAENRFINFYEAWGESYSHFVAHMQKLGYVWGKHYLPHDAKHKRQMEKRVASPEDMLRDLGLTNIEVVPRVEEVIHGIQAVRDQFSSYWFDETNCKEGLAHLGSYRKEYNERLQAFKDTPLHDIHSEAADALRQHAQGYNAGATPYSSKPNRKRRGWRTT